MYILVNSSSVAQKILDISLLHYPHTHIHILNMFTLIDNKSNLKYLNISAEHTLDKYN